MGLPQENFGLFRRAQQEVGRHAEAGELKVMDQIRRFSSGRPWESAYRYSRAVVYGGVFETCLTSPSAPDGTIVHAGDVHGQTRRCLAIIGETLKTAGYGFDDIVRTDIYMLDTRLWE